MSEPGTPRLAEIDLPAFGMPDTMPEIAPPTRAYGDPALSDRPAYLVDVVRELAGVEEVSNVTELLIGADDGMRVINEPEQLAQFERAR